MSKYAANDPEVKIQVERAFDAQNKLNERLLELAATHTTLKLTVERTMVGSGERTSFIQDGEEYFRLHSQEALAKSFASDLNNAGLEVVRIVNVSE